MRMFEENVDEGVGSGVIETGNLAVTESEVLEPEGVLEWIKPEPEL